MDKTGQDSSGSAGTAQQAFETLRTQIDNGLTDPNAGAGRQWLDAYLRALRVSPRCAQAPLTPAQLVYGIEAMLGWCTDDPQEQAALESVLQAGTSFRLQSNDVSGLISVLSALRYDRRILPDMVTRIGRHLTWLEQGLAPAGSGFKGLPD